MRGAADAAALTTASNIQSQFSRRRCRRGACHRWNWNQFRTDTRDHCAGRQTRRRGEADRGRLGGDFQGLFGTGRRQRAARKGTEEVPERVQTPKPKCCRTRRAPWSKGYARKAGSSQWQATASTTRRPSQRRKSASPWGRARTSRSRAPASPCSRATSPESCAPAACRRRPCATSDRTCSSRSSTTPPASRSPPAFRDPPIADHRSGGDGAVLGQRRRQRAAIATRAAVNAVGLSRPSVLFHAASGRMTGHSAVTGPCCR